MPIRPEYLVRGLDGRPLPPQDLLDRLRQYDPRIGLFYTNAAWAITEAWREDDPRRAHIQAGDMQPEMAFDICGYLPITCSLDEALPYIQRELRHHTAESFAAVRYAVNYWNGVQQDAALESTVLGAISNDMAASNIVSGAGITNVPASITPGVGASDRMAAARAAKAARKAAEVKSA